MFPILLRIRWTSLKSQIHPRCAYAASLCVLFLTTSYEVAKNNTNRVTVVVLSVCPSVRASSSTTGYEAANEWHQWVVNDEKIDINVAIFPKRLRSRDMA